MESVRTILLPSGLPRFLWPECVMSVAHGQNMTPNSALYHERKQSFVDDMMHSHSNGAPAGDVICKERGGVKKKEPKQVVTARDEARRTEKEIHKSRFDQILSDKSDRDIIPYLSFFRDVTDEHFLLLLKQQLPWGTPVYAYPRAEDAKKLDQRGLLGNWVGHGQGPSMQRVFTQDVPGGRVRAIRQVVVTDFGLASHVKQYDARAVAAAAADEAVAAHADDPLDMQEEGGEHVSDGDVAQFAPAATRDGDLLRQQSSILDLEPGHGKIPIGWEMHARIPMEGPSGSASPRSARSSELQKRDIARDTPELVEQAHVLAREHSRAALQPHPPVPPAVHGEDRYDLRPTRVRARVRTRDAGLLDPQLRPFRPEDEYSDDISTVYSDDTDDILPPDEDEDMHDEGAAGDQPPDEAGPSSSAPGGASASAAVEPTSSPVPAAKDVADPPRRADEAPAGTAQRQLFDAFADEEMEVVSGGEIADPDPAEGNLIDPPLEVRAVPVTIQAPAWQHACM